MRRRRRFQIVAGGASAIVAASGALLLSTGTPAHADVSPGVGNAYAQAFQDTPEEGSLRVGAVLAESLAGHTNGIARVQSQGLDLTAIGTSLQGYNCGQAPSQSQVALDPQPLQTETGQDGAAQGVTEDPSYGVNKEGQAQPVPPTFGSTEHVQATDTPYGEADTSYGSVNVPGNPFQVGGMTTRAFSGLVNGQRVAAAFADIKSINFMAGAVVLNGLHWEATFPSTGGAKPTASFSVGQVLIQGKQAAGDPQAELQAAAAALAPLGIDFEMPKIQTVNGNIFVSPLQINVVPNSARDAILTAIVNGTHPVVSPIANGLENGFGPPEPPQLTQELCQSDTPITVADIAVASVDGSGSYYTTFGGVSAGSGAAPVNPFNLSLPSLSAGSLSQFVPGTPGSAGSAGSAGSSALSSGSVGGGAVSSLTGSSAATSGGAASSAGGSPAGTSTAMSPIAATGHAAGGPLLGIGLGGLAALALLVEGDRRIMRRAQTGGTFSNFDD